MKITPSLVTRAGAATIRRSGGAELITIETPYAVGPVGRLAIRRALRLRRRYLHLRVTDEVSRAGLVWLGLVTVNGPWHLVRRFAIEWDRRVSS